MFDANTEQLRTSTISDMFRNSLKEVGTKLATIPPFLVLVAPRHQRSQRSYQWIIPDQKIVLDTNILQTACANLECRQIEADHPTKYCLYSCNVCSQTNFDSTSPTTDATINCLCMKCLSQY